MRRCADAVSPEEAAMERAYNLTALREESIYVVAISQSR
jgi:hypothetical protein